MSEELEKLDVLEDQYLYVFIAGPGLGEGILVVRPMSFWLFLDGCSVSAKRGAILCLEQIWDKYKPDRALVQVGYVLTHPHEDHVHGIPELVERLEPDFVCMGGHEDPHAPDAWRTLYRESSDARQLGAVAAVRNAFEAFKTWEARTGRKVTSLRNGRSLALSDPHVKALVRHPEENFLNTFYAVNRPISGNELNEISLVLEIEYGTTKLILPGDLPVRRKKDAPVLAECWQRAMSNHPHFANHSSLKIPHHGSEEALPVELLCDSSQSRHWWVTPFNKCSLPRPLPDEGLGTLLRYQTSVYLTALPASKKLQASYPPPARVTLAELRDHTLTARGKRKFLHNGVQIRPGSAKEALDPIWAAAFDNTGTMRGCWRGRAAIEVTTPPTLA